MRAVGLNEVHPQRPLGSVVQSPAMAPGPLRLGLGQQLVIDYRPGAGGNIGAEIVAKSAPDGYMTLIAAASFLINPSLIKNIPFDAVKDFTPLGVIVDIPAGLFVHPSLPVKNVKDLIALAKKRPGDLNYSSSGRGAVGHLSGALLESTTGIKVVHIPYKGAGPGITDLIGGQIQMYFATPVSVMQHIKSGRLRGLGSSGSAGRRSGASARPRADPSRSREKIIDQAHEISHQFRKESMSLDRDLSLG